MRPFVLVIRIVLNLELTFVLLHVKVIHLGQEGGFDLQSNISVMHEIIKGF